MYLDSIKALVLAVGVAVAFGAGFAVQGWRLGAQIAELKASRANEIAAQSQAALNDLSDASKKINQAANDYASIETTLGKKMDQLRKDFKDAKPLPPDCRPDSVRVRNLDAAIDAANEAAAGRKAQ